MQLNALGKLQKYMGKSEKVAIVNSYVYANFNYQSGILVLVNQLEKLKKSKNVA